MDIKDSIVRNDFPHYVDPATDSGFHEYETWRSS